MRVSGSTRGHKDRIGHEKRSTTTSTSTSTSHTMTCASAAAVSRFNRLVLGGAGSVSPVNFLPPRRPGRRTKVGAALQPISWLKFSLSNSEQPDYSDPNTDRKHHQHPPISMYSTGLLTNRSSRADNVMHDTSNEMSHPGSSAHRSSHTAERYRPLIFGHDTTSAASSSESHRVSIDASINCTFSEASLHNLEA